MSNSTIAPIVSGTATKSGTSSARNTRETARAGSSVRCLLWPVVHIALEELPTRLRAGDLAVEQHRYGIGDLLDEIEVVRRHHDGNPRAPAAR